MERQFYVSEFTLKTSFIGDDNYSYEVEVQLRNTSQEKQQYTASFGVFYECDPNVSSAALSKIPAYGLYDIYPNAELDAMKKIVLSAVKKQLGLFKAHFDIRSSQPEIQMVRECRKAGT